jgi:hypothetical protein
MYGLSRAVSTLAKLRCLGSGPIYHKLGGKQVAYTDAALDAYAASVISPSLRSTGKAA